LPISKLSDLGKGHLPMELSLVLRIEEDSI